MQYVLRYRWQRARMMLANSEASVAEVALSVGVTDPFYFSRAFKRLEGMSPRQYRIAQRQPDSP
jgi:AraC-like DNA-binding protein